MTRDHRDDNLLTNDITMTSTDNNNNDDISSRHTWDIADNVFPTMEYYDEFVEYPMGYVKYAYSGDCVEARTHQSGWAARNANNHNQAILKKSCLGVLLCDRQCRTDDGRDIVRVRPSICDKARKKQINKACTTKGCPGHLRLRACRGHGGYPVTHFWREVRDPRPGVTAATTIFFQAKGEHDHPPPQRKSMPSTANLKARPKENRKPLTSRCRRRKLTPALPAAKMMSSAPYHGVIDKHSFLSPIDALSPLEPHYWTGSPGHHVTSFSNSHVTSLTNHSHAHDSLQLLGSERCSNLNPTLQTNNYNVVDQGLTNSWCDRTMPSRVPTIDTLQPSKCLPSARQLPVGFNSVDDVISGRQRLEYCSYNEVSGPYYDQVGWPQSSDACASRGHLCLYGKDSSSAVCNMTSGPTSWFHSQQLPAYSACANYRMSRIPDVTATQCGWTDSCDFEELMWRENFISPVSLQATFKQQTLK